MPAHNGHLQLPFAEGVHKEMEFKFAECTGLKEQVRGKWQFKRGDSGGNEPKEAMVNIFYLLLV